MNLSIYPGLVAQVGSRLSFVLSPSHLLQIPVSGGGDAPVHSNHLTVSEQDASWGDQG